MTSLACQLQLWLASRLIARPFPRSYVVIRLTWAPDKTRQTFAMNMDQIGRAVARPTASVAQKEPVVGRHRKNGPPRSYSEASSTDRQAARIATAEQCLIDAYASARTAGVDPDIVRTAFDSLRECIAQLKECNEYARRQVSLADYERGEVRRSRVDPAPLTTVSAAVPDIPGYSLCPDPDAVDTPAEFMDTLRMYRIWAGKPSFRVMERQCGRRFAAATFCTALRSDELPSLEKVQAIIIGCGGSEEHRLAFASAWRRLKLPNRAASKSNTQSLTDGSLYSMSETA